MHGADLEQFRHHRTFYWTAAPWSIHDSLGICPKPSAKSVGYPAGGGGGSFPRPFRVSAQA